LRSRHSTDALEKQITKGTRVGVKGTDTRLGRVESAHEKLKNTWNVRMDGIRNTSVLSASLLLILGDTVGLSPGSRLARAVTTGGFKNNCLEGLDRIVYQETQD
jgi:hypothetical protein